MLTQPTLDAARALVGARLVRDDSTGRRVGRIVEVEAYIGETDQASHARFGRTARNEVMYGPAGVAYVYLVYGMYDCLNIVTEPAGHPAAVLVRAVEPLEGIELIRSARLAATTARRRAVDDDVRRAAAARVERLPVDRLASGPGLVAAAFGLDRTWTGTDLCDADGRLRLEAIPDTESPPPVRATRRIGVDYAGDDWASRPWRFVIPGHSSASGPRPVA
ncbi:MAG: DNA-3-methyladenine glycosylase [Chloroflexota bacterium]